MDAEKRKRLEAAGFCLGDATDFLELLPEEVAFVEMKLSLSRYLKELCIAPVSIFCRDCGTKLESSDTFCPSCGSKVSA